MNTTQPTAQPTDQPTGQPTALELFSRIIDVLIKTVLGYGNAAGLERPLPRFIAAYIRRLSNNFLTRAARAPHPARLTHPRARTAHPAKPPAPYTLPSSPNWLRRLIDTHLISCYASQLQHQITSPEISHLLAQNPGLGRPLRPLCRMLGIPLPPTLRRTQKPRPKPAFGPPNPTPPTPKRPKSRSLLPRLRRPAPPTPPPRFTPQPLATWYFANFPERR
ncbi:hypothetical protein ACOSOMT5_P0227 [Acidiphilium sp. MT5]